MTFRYVLAGSAMIMVPCVISIAHMAAVEKNNSQNDSKNPKNKDRS